MTLTLSSNYYLQQTEQQEVNINTFLVAYSNQLDTSENTKKTYLVCVSKFLKWLSDNAIEFISYELMVDYKNHLKDMYKSKTVNTHITALKDFFKYLERRGFTNYAKDLKKERTDNNFTKDSLTANQVKDIFKSIDTTTEEGARASAIFRLLVGTGLRACEVVRADIGDIRTNGNKKVLYVRGKGETQKTKYVILYPSVMQAIQNYLRFRENPKDNEPLFTSNSNRNNGKRLTTRTIQRIVKGLFKDNGIISERLTTHSTRHTAINLSLDNGADILQVQAMARHTNINTTMIYVHNLQRLSNNAEEKIEELFNC